jgi:hypothetical protein
MSTTAPYAQINVRRSLINFISAPSLLTYNTYLYNICEEAVGGIDIE